MDLVECLFEPDIWNSIIDKGVDKTIPSSILRKYSFPEARLDLLRRIVSGEYHIKPPKVTRIPKDNGTYREIYINTPEDRLVLAGINQAYYKLYEDRLSPACKAYRVNHSCGKTVREVASHTINGYKLDLSKYFDSVPITVINEALDELDTGSPLDSIVREYYNTNLVIIDGKLTERYKSLAQGCAVAAFLSNYVLRKVDSKMTKLCTYYCRYSDDMILLADNPDVPLQVLKDMLEELGLKLNPEKIEHIDPWHEFKFLGFGIAGRKISISQKDFLLKKREIKHVCKLVCSDRTLTSKEKLSKAIRTVQNIFFSRQEPFYGWIYGKAVYINDYERIIELDKFCKEHIRAAVTGKWNFTSNEHKVSEQDLRNAGYVSLLHMAKMAKAGRDIFQQEHLLHIKQHIPIFSRGDL